MEKKVLAKDIEIRHARMEDKDEVLGIHDNVYDGQDYLPSYFETFIKCRNTKCYIASLQDVMVGFCAELLVDDGRTSVIRAGRVSPCVQGTGVYKKLIEHVKRFSEAESHTFVSDAINPAIYKESFQQAYRHVLSLSMSEYVFDVKQLPDFRSAMSFQRPSHIDDKLFERYMTSPTTSQYLFPYNRMIMDCIPYSIMPSNVPLLNLQNSKFFSDVTENADGDVSGLLSVSTLFSCKRPPFACYIDIYGSDLTSLRDHVLAHLSRLYENVNDKVGLSVFINEDNDINELKKILEEFGITWQVPGRLCVFESKVNTYKQ